VANTSGARNNAFGYASLTTNITGADNCAFGWLALGNSTGNQNCAFGNQALGANVGSADSSAFGYNALLLSTGANNSAFGSTAGNAVSSGTGNSAFGQNSLGAASTGADSSAFGRNAGLALTTGGTCTFLGATADTSLATAANSTALGFGSTVDASNMIVFGNASVTVIRPMSDNACTLGTAANRWSDLRSVLINGADYGFENGWKMVESEVFPGYSSGIALAGKHWDKGVSLWEDRKAVGNQKPVFAVTEDWIEYKGRRIDEKTLDRILQLTKNV
jgi:hypothetical protein